MSQNLGVDGRFVSVGGINVPCAEHDVVQRCHAHYVLIQQIFLVVAFAYADFEARRSRSSHEGR